MDDDEKEMIAEARVRLANIKGKKAKRIAREKVLDEARRLAQLQKFRELKSAGIDFVIERKRKKKRHEFDYENEVPIERKPLELVFSSKEERLQDKGDVNIGNITINQLEGRRRDEEESKKRREDLRKLNKIREMDLPNRIKRVNALNPMNFIKKRNLELEEPQLKQTDIEELAKLNKRSFLNEEMMSVNNKKIKRSSDFLLQENCMEEIQSIVGQTVTPSTHHKLMERARETLEVADPNYENKSNQVITDSETGSVNSYFTSGLTMKDKLGKNQMNLEKINDGQALKTVNPYKELVKTLKEDSSNSNLKKDNQDTESKQESVYSVKSTSVISKMNDYLSINSPWQNTKRINENYLPNNENKIDYSMMSEKKKKRKLQKLLKEEFEKLPEAENDFEIDYKDLIENLQQTKQQDLYNNYYSTEKTKVQKQRSVFKERMNIQRELCKDAVEKYFDEEMKFNVMERIKELEKSGDVFKMIEKNSWKLMAQDLDLYSDDDDEDDEIEQEYFEKVDILCQKKEKRNYEIVSQQMKELLNQKAYFEQKGVNYEQIDHYVKLQNEFSLEDVSNDNDENLEEFNTLVKEVKEMEKTALILGNLNNLEKSHCIQEIKAVDDRLQSLKVIEQELQNQYQQTLL